MSLIPSSLQGTVEFDGQQLGIWCHRRRESSHMCFIVVVVVMRTLHMRSNPLKFLSVRCSIVSYEHNIISRCLQLNHLA